MKDTGYKVLIDPLDVFEKKRHFDAKILEVLQGHCGIWSRERKIEEEVLHWHDPVVFIQTNINHLCKIFQVS